MPFIPRPINMADRRQWNTWLVHDQRFVSDRPDVLVYQTTTLDKPVHIMGAPQVDLFAATSGTDSDWVVKIIDVYPNTSPEVPDQGAKPSMAGFELPIGIEIFRGRYVHGFDKPKAADARQGGGIQIRLAQRRPRLPARPQDHGAGAVEPLPALRPQPANVR